MFAPLRAGRALALGSLLFVSACGGGMSPMDAGGMGGGTAEVDAAVPCAPGTEGCECASNRCGRNTRGEQLLCQGGTCAAMTCPAGDPGCVCRSGSTCNDASSTCTGGFCVANGCVPGDRNCTCLAGGCTTGSVCLEGSVCVDSTGYEGGQCLANGRCLRGSRCDTSTGRCVFCTPGSAGCACNTNDACGAGLVCTAGLCLGTAQLPPATPKCFTACSADTRSPDGGRLACGPDRLLEGCLDGLVCNRGTCGMPGGAPRACTQDLDCPGHQVCLTGACYSNCDVNADCGSGLGCYRHACRPPCTVGRVPCGAGMACTADDGQQGFCTPVGATATSLAAPVPGGFSLPTDALELSNVQPQGTFVISSKSAVPETLTIRKLWHSATSASGVVERVEAPRAADGGTGYRTCDPLRNECPLPWLSLQAPGVASTQAATITVNLNPRCIDPAVRPDAGGVPCPTVSVGNAGGTNFVRWEGELEITARDSTERVFLRYLQRPDGQWTGSMYYFGTFNNQGLDGWINAPNKGVASAATNVANAFIRKWTGLRTASGVNDGWDEFLAVLTSTREESWRFDAVKQACLRAGQPPGAACFPYTKGLRAYEQNIVTNPIPSGISELPIAMNLKVNAMDPTLFEGRVVSSLAMHYPGNPGVALQLASDPTRATSCASADCLLYLKDLNTVAPNVNRLVSTVGGRYLSTDGTCRQGFVPVEVPWLVPGFTEGTRSTTGGLTRVECRDNELPYAPATVPGAPGLNVSLAGGNPVPDGNPRRRTMRFLDGALVNQSELFLIFEESFDSFIPDAGTTGRATAYGFMRLRRSPAALTPNDFTGLVEATSTRPQPTPPGATCDAQLQSDLGIGPATSASVRLNTLLGSTAGFTQVTNTAAVHYFCEDTGLFNGGAGDNGSATATRVACPPGSKVTFFNVCATDTGPCTRTVASIANEPCQTQLVPDPANVTCRDNSECRSGKCGTGGVCQRASCGDTLRAWKANNAVVQEGGADEQPLLFTCNSGTAPCDNNRLDLRADKTFFRRQASTQRVSLPLPALIDAAFRYKTRFRSSLSGSTVGFAPVQCRRGSNAVPYCYDPPQIDEARKRVDCLVNLYDDAAAYGALQPAERTLLINTLKEAFSEGAGGRDGFERLNAELLIMLGDESLTAAYASRFDLAAAGGATFRGSLFEPSGIDLSGVAGAEMANLYQAVQYYQLALDRMYRLGPDLQVSLARETSSAGTGFLTSQSVTTWLERLVRAASQKSRAWGEVARRYQTFNRPDLARRVIERAYVSTWLESALLNRLLLDIMARSTPAQLPQLQTTLTRTQRNFRLALIDMRDVYSQISSDVNFFGYAPDYVPFPAVDTGSTSAFTAYDILSALARQRLDLAKTREQTALTFGKQGKVDAAQFQSELTTIRNTYENQLADVCGTFTTPDGRVWPAIRKYAGLSDQTTLVGDPCGLLGNGAIHNVVINLRDARQKFQGAQVSFSNLNSEIEIERGRAATQCGLATSLAEFQYDTAIGVANVQQKIEIARAAMAATAGVVNAFTQSLNTLSSASAETLPIAGPAAVTTQLALSGVAIAQEVVDLEIANLNREIAETQAGTFTAIGANQCAAIDADSGATVEKLFLSMRLARLESLRAMNDIAIAAGDLQKLRNNAQRLQVQQEEAEQLAIDVVAAQNDPNVRIYQNDAIINADVSFNAAMAAAYRLTRVFEYYTSQSYAKKEQLFVIRMVTAGQYNLENYLLELDNAFNDFEEQYGNPDLRVLSLSLKEDIFRIPLLGSTPASLSEADRNKLFTERLLDVSLRDANGYLVIPFSTELSQLSPLTLNHKVRHVEVDLQGVLLGDPTARVYVRMSGTGSVRNVGDDVDFYLFDPRLGVVNASLNGVKPYDPEVYRNYRFRDRPLVNSQWELILNTRDEPANRDVQLQTLTDVRLLFYYSDFTAY
ncbi:MAG: hypothetical protein JNJ54_09990 [Myxococcaceae bacterium]|nr:hypothetical protein [Myxococcaceae bacterium]